VCDYGHGKRQQKRKRKGTMSYVVMFGYVRGPTHCKAHTWVGVRVGLTILQKTNISKMQIKN